MRKQSVKWVQRSAVSALFVGGSWLLASPVLASDAGPVETPASPVESLLQVPASSSLLAFGAACGLALAWRRLRQ